MNVIKYWVFFKNRISFLTSNYTKAVYKYKHPFLKFYIIENRGQTVVVSEWVHTVAMNEALSPSLSHLERKRK